MEYSKVGFPARLQSLALIICRNLRETTCVILCGNGWLPTRYREIHFFIALKQYRELVVKMVVYGRGTLKEKWFTRISVFSALGSHFHRFPNLLPIGACVSVCCSVIGSQCAWLWVTDGDVTLLIVASLCFCRQCDSVAPVCDPALYSCDNRSFILKGTDYQLMWFTFER